MASKAPEGVRKPENKGGGPRRRLRKPDGEGPSGEGTPVGEGTGRTPPPSWLTRSRVYQQVPVAVRGRLDAAILLRPADCPTLEAIARKFDLEGRYGVSLGSLAGYAEKLEQLVRPAMMSQVMAGVLGCLPASYRHQLVAGGQVMLLSRVVQALADDEREEALSVADLAKLAAVLAAVSGSRPTKSSAGGSGKAAHKSARNVLAGGAAIEDANQLNEAVKMVYGLYRLSASERNTKEDKKPPINADAPSHCVAPKSLRSASEHSSERG